MITTLNQFNENLKQTKELGMLASAIQSKMTNIIDVSDIWRAQIVLAVSALDHFIHDFTRFGMIEIAQGTRPKTDAYLRFQIPLNDVEIALTGEPYNRWLGETIRSQHSWQSFQDPDKIANAIRLFSNIKLWDKVGVEMAMPAKEVKLRLNLIVERRNKIAHEADMDPANPGFRWPIDADMTSQTTDFIKHLGEAIFKVAA